MFDVDNNVSVTRFENNKGSLLGMLSQMYIERGERDDWDLLSSLHYKEHNLPGASKIYRCRLRDQTIGVCVMGNPRLTLKQRRHVFENLKTGGDTFLVNQHRAKWINEHMTINSRVVLDTMFRGAGIAYRMQNLVFRMHGKKYVEFQSSMSKYNKFAEKAGVRMAKPTRSYNYEKGMEFFRTLFKCHPADYDAVLKELNSMGNARRQRVEAELRQFYLRNSSLELAGVGGNIKAAKKIAEMKIEAVVKNLQQLVFASPLYGIYINPDAGRELPQRLPLLAFDLQGTDEPLQLTRIETWQQN